MYDRSNQNCLSFPILAAVRSTVMRLSVSLCFQKCMVTILCQITTYVNCFVNMILVFSWRSFDLNNFFGEKSQLTLIYRRRGHTRKVFLFACDMIISLVFLFDFVYPIWGSMFGVNNVTIDVYHESLNDENITDTKSNISIFYWIILTFPYQAPFVIKMTFIRSHA